METKNQAQQSGHQEEQQPVFHKVGAVGWSDNTEMFWEFFVLAA